MLALQAGFRARLHLQPKPWPIIVGAAQMLEACLESHGVNVKDLHTPPVDMSTELCYNTATSRGPMRMDSHMRRNSGQYSHVPRMYKLYQDRA